VHFLTMSSMDVLRMQEDVPARWRGSTNTRTFGPLGSTPGVRAEQQVPGEHVLTHIICGIGGCAAYAWGRPRLLGKGYAYAYVWKDGHWVLGVRGAE
jgi:hypothetical protein